MVDDKRDGEELFEDLDKFFAPIKDVDFPEPEEPEAATTPQEEHVAVQRPEEAEAVEEVEEVEAEEAEAEGPEAVSGAWYDTQVMESIDELGEEDVVEDLAEEEGTVTVPDAALEGQEGLFASGQGIDEEDEDWPAAEQEPAAPSDTWVQQHEPTEEEVEAAAEHFAESVRSEEPEPAMATPFGDEVEEGSGDILSDLGAEDVEEDILSDLDEDAAAVRTVKVGSEGLGGPSWQEPTSVEVGADLDRGGGRDVPAAFMTGLVLAVVAFGSLLISRSLFAVVATAIVLIGQFELFVAMKKHHRQPATAIGLVTGGLVLWGAYDRGEGAILAMAGLGILATFLWFMAVPAVHRKDVLVNIGLTVLNVAYVPVLAAFLLLILGIGSSSDGRALVAAVIGLTFVYDTMAFLGGATFGGVSIRRALAPDTSPKKSWEGLIVATIVTLIVSMGLVPSFVGPFEDRRVDSLLLALVISAAATFGDLAESLIKRDLGMKDMGSILPGHGGVLDRIDSLLFAAPAAYLLFRVIKIA